MLVRLARRYSDLDVGRINVAIEPSAQFIAVKLALPPGHDDASNAIAAQIRQRTAFAHELVDAEDDRHPGHKLGPDGSERTGERDETGAGDA
jgi:hypothetical protein